MSLAWIAKSAGGTGGRGDGETGGRGDGGTGRRGDGETRRRGDGEMGRRGDGETGGRGDGVPFAEKMDALTAKLAEQFARGEELKKVVKENLKGIGYEF